MIWSEYSQNGTMTNSYSMSITHNIRLKRRSVYFFLKRCKKKDENLNCLELLGQKTIKKTN